MAALTSMSGFSTETPANRDVPTDRVRRWYDLFRFDQLSLIGLFFVLVALLMLALIVPNINQQNTLIRVDELPLPNALTQLKSWPTSDWAFQAVNETTLTTLTLGFAPPPPPEFNEGWRYWETNWPEQLVNPASFKVPTVTYSLYVLVVFLGGGLFALLPQRRPRSNSLLLVYVAVVAAVLAGPALAIGFLNDFLLPIVIMLLLVFGGYLLAIFSNLTTQEGMATTQKGWLIVCGVLIIPTVMVLAAAGKSTNMVTLMASSFRLATPIIIGAMAGIWCERAGVVNIAIEGMMLTGAAFGFVAYALIDSANPGQTGLWVGILIAAVAGCIMSLLHAWLSITFKTDQIISGTVINILALGVTSFVRREVLLSADAARQTLPGFQIPVLGEIPILGEILFTGKPIFFTMFVLVAGTHIMLFYTRWGLRTRAVGENPHAADTLGINVTRNRYINVLAGGFIAGLAGAWFSLETAGSFDEGMTDGLGFIALAAVIFGKWRPLPAAAGGLLFGFSRALDTRFQILEVGVPVEFVQMTPYIVTMVVLAGLVGRAIPPRAVGQPYEKE